MELVALTFTACVVAGLGLYDLHMARNYREVQFKRRKAGR